MEVHRLHTLGVDGIKLIPKPHVNAEIFQTLCDEVRKLQMKAGIAIHIPQFSELDALIASNAGKAVLSLEHTYGIPQAAIPGTQRFPPG